jgi:hypothetical protein
MGSQELFAGLALNLDLPISASQVARTLAILVFNLNFWKGNIFIRFEVQKAWKST